MKEMTCSGENEIILLGTPKTRDLCLLACEQLENYVAIGTDC